MIARGRSTAAAALACLAAFLPFMLVLVPPLVDAPGHLAQFAIQAAAPESPLRRYFDFHWALRLNLGTDLLVEALRRPFGLVRAFWLTTALIPPLTVAGALALARAANRGGASAAWWALPFAWSSVFLFGLFNYALAMALALLAFAGWIALDRRPRLREALAWIAIPALMIVHAIGGGLLPAMIAARAAGHARDRRAFLREVRPLLALVPVLLLWRLTSPAGGLSVGWSLPGKATAIVTALRDQQHAFDIACLALTLAVPVAGRLLGARFGRANAAVVLMVAALFLLSPDRINGSSAADSRLVPPLAIVLLALQDWSAVRPRWRRIVAGAGIALFATRLAVTAASFAGYARSYAAEAGALPHIGPGARVLVLVHHPCRASRAWAGARLDHFGSLATVERAAWTNTMWDVADIHLLGIHYRPSPLFYDDPSHYVWPADCLDAARPRDAAEARQQRRTIAQALAIAPLAGVDYLWLIGTPLPDGPWRGRLRLVWSHGSSALYRTLSALPAPSPR